MATTAKVIEEITTFGDDCHVVTWTAMANGDDGDPVELSGSTIRSCQVEGTFGSGGSVAFEGSNDGTNYAALRTTTNAVIAVTADDLQGFPVASRYFRPRVTAGDGTTDLNVTLFVRRPSGS